MIYYFDFSKYAISLRPIFETKVAGYNMLCLYDTGASISVITSTEEFKRVFGALHPRYLCDYTLKGFGKIGLNSRLYKIPSFCILDNSVNAVSLVLNDMWLAVTDAPDIEVDMIFASHVFSGTQVQLDFNTRSLRLFTNKSVHTIDYKVSGVSSYINLN